MSIYALDTALWGIYTSQQNAEQIRTNPETYVRGYDLTAEEADALRNQNFGALLDLGAHPFLMYKMALRIEGGFSIDFLQRYLGPLRNHSLRDIVT
ncbi:hypothetical protein [Pseudarthrobacter sp. AG30]|uniref:hypothetical protein n=1 Tax=Pseudarthrobacter sp. AG30 TaxID=2249742 RepID=UPI0014030D3C|nr:hypothetical protein [Pseudarthrobacter sp. AG30]